MTQITTCKMVRCEPFSLTPLWFQQEIGEVSNMSQQEIQIASASGKRHVTQNSFELKWVKIPRSSSHHLSRFVSPMWKNRNQQCKICNWKPASLWHTIIWRFAIIYVEFQKVIIFTPKCRTICHFDISGPQLKPLNSSILLPYAFSLLINNSQ